MALEFALATTNKEILACFPVLFELRPDLIMGEFLDLICDMQQQGYQLLYAKELDQIVAVAGFRLGRSLAWKRYLYVDDLVTLDSERSKGYGAALLQWLSHYAAEAGCQQFHLDSGVQRSDAHRFYKREGFQISSYHFAKIVLKK